MSLSKIALVTPFISGGGGGAVVASLIDMLSHDYQIEIFTFQGADIEELNRYYGTKIETRNLKISLIKTVFTAQRIVRGPLGVQLLCKFVRKINTEFDIIISVGREMDFGAKGIQYIFYPTLSRSPKILKRMASYSNLKSIIASLVRRLYPILSGFNYRRMMANSTLTISNWTRDIIRQTYGIDAVVVYPPVQFAGIPKPWAEKADEFISLGRIEPDKNIEQTIDILQGVRAHGYDIKLSIVGALATELKEYADSLINRYPGGESWISIEENLPRKALENRLTTARYGIHGRANEHFGISVVELIKAGCIPFIPNSGGQVEILMHNSNLLYENSADAVRKIVHVLADDKLRLSLASDLAAQAKIFSLERFKTEMLAAIDRYCLEKRLEGNPPTSVDPVHKN